MRLLLCAGVAFATTTTTTEKTRCFGNDSSLDLERWTVSSTPVMREAMREKKTGTIALEVANSDASEERFRLHFGMVEGYPWPQPLGEAAYQETRRSTRLRSGDVVVASYPKSGTTWTEQIVLLLLHGSQVAAKLDPESRNAFAAGKPYGKFWLEPSLARAGISRDRRLRQQRTFDDVPSPRLIKSHAPLHMLLGVGNHSTAKAVARAIDESGVRVVYVARNAKDAAVSLFFQRAPMNSASSGRRRRRGSPGSDALAFPQQQQRQQRREEGTARKTTRVFSQQQQRTRRRPQEGRRRLVAERRMPMDAWSALYLSGHMSCGSYFDHVATWHAASKVSEGTLFLTYEDLKKDAFAAVARIARHLRLDRDDAEIHRIINASSFDAMKASAASRASPSSPSSSRRAAHNARYEIPPGTRLDQVNATSSSHLRQGRVGSWPTYFSPALSRQFDAAYDRNMQAAAARAATALGLDAVHPPHFDFGVPPSCQATTMVAQ